MVDAEQFMRVSQGLKEALAALGAADLGSGQRGRWQRRLMAITETATRDLAGAEMQLERFRTDWSRLERRGRARG
jgi:hypothetical protein